MVPSTRVSSSRLLKLPAELRNAIYELVFTTDHDDTGKIDLIATHPPSKSLFLTCRQIYHETRKIYKDHYQNFWSQGDFILDLNHSQAAECFAKQHVQDFEHIGKLQVNMRNLRFKLVERRGGWHVGEAEYGYGGRQYYGWDVDGRWCGRVRLTEAQLEECYSRGMEDVPLYDSVRETFKRWL